ncbi:MAG: hypothetical protein KBC47_04595 [Candidatus Peribacteraceae bacterium]|nr:hypothetical protein [Candidatus Peribacteraceae bacterium]
MTNFNIPSGIESQALANAPSAMMSPAAFATNSITSIAATLMPAVSALATLGIVGLGMKAIITGKNPIGSKNVA